MTTGQFIKEHRLRRGLTQEDLAAKTDLSARTIQRIENDEVDPRAFTLRNIAIALELDFESLNSFGDPVFQDYESKGDDIWVPLLHLSGLFNLLLPPLIIWLIKKNNVKGIRTHGIDVINFQLSILLYMSICGVVAMFIFPIVILICLVALFSFGVILVNTIKVFNGQPYTYPLVLTILKR